MQITHVEYDPAGDDVQGEVVWIENLSETSYDMNNWTLTNTANHTFTFPSLTLDAGATVKVWTKIGTDTATDLYWGSGRAIWNNAGDTAWLRDAQGRLVDGYSY